MTTTADSVIARMNALYGPPNTEDVEIFIGEYQRALAGFSSEALAHGADYAIRNNPKSFWPAVGAVYQACRSKQDAIDAAARSKAEMAEALRLRAERDRRPELTPEAQALCTRLYEEAKAKLAAVSQDEPSLEPNWVKGQRPMFEDMMRNSPNKGLYRVNGGTK